MRGERGGELSEGVQGGGTPGQGQRRLLPNLLNNPLYTLNPRVHPYLNKD